MELWHIWVIVGICFLAAEALTPELVLGCLAIGMFAAGATAYLDAPLSWQIVAFIVATLALMFGVRPRMKALLYRGADPRVTGVEALVGKTGVVTDALPGDPEAGRVKLGGEEWRAVAEDGSAIAAGTQVVVIAVEAATVVVRLKP